MTKKTVLMFFLGIFPYTVTVFAQTHLPIHQGGDCECAKIGIGIDIGHPLVTSYTEESSFSPNVPASPYRAYDNIGHLGFSPEAGLILIIKPNKSLGIFFDTRFSIVKGVASSLPTGADHDLTPQGGGTPVVGTVSISDISASVQYLRNLLGVQIHFELLKIPFYFSPFITTRVALNNIKLHYVETVDKPTGATFVTNNQTSIPDDYEIVETSKYNIGLGAAFGYEFSFSSSFIGQLDLEYSHYFGSSASDGTRQDFSRQLDPIGTSLATFKNRDLQFPLGIFFKLIWMP